jgi:lysophospholipase L1-like esterase
MKWITAILLFGAVGGIAGLPGVGQVQPDTAKQQRWVGSWAASQQGLEPQNHQPGVDPALLTDATVRQVVHLSLGGMELRLQLSNAFGDRPLTVDSVHLARTAQGPPTSAIDPASDHAVTFAGRDSVTIPAGATYFSDPVSMTVPALANVTISFHLADPPSAQTTHPGSRATSWLLHGEHAADADLAGAEKMVRWMQIASIEVAEPAKADAVVAFGDSITDGHASTTDGNDRWTDVLARRLQQAGMTVGVLNEGIGGNHLLTDGLGQSALARMDRDVIAQEGVRYVMVFEGINDIGMLARGKNASPEEHKVLVERMIGAYEQIVMRAHAHGMKVIGVTVTPFMGSDYYVPTAANEADREAVNAWIRAPGHFDAVVDFDKVVRDPTDPSRLLPAYDSGDHLHPGPKGYQAMGDAVPLRLFR